jgi:uncharacterized lipoprotein YbaY
MKTLGFGGLVVAMALANAGCAPSTPPAPAAHAGSGQQSAVVVDVPDQTFICPSGALAEVRRDAPAGVAIISYMGESTNMMQEVGADPPRFVSGSSTLTLGPTQATLRRGRNTALTCQLRPVTPTRGTVWGTISKMDRMALVPGTRARVLIVDVSRAGAPALEIARTDIVAEGNQVPLHFLIRYDESRILPGMRYSLSARIEDPKGRLLYITDTHNPLFEEAGAAQPPVDVMLVRVTGGQ